MLIVTTKIFISQVPSLAFPNRNGEFIFDFVCEFSANDSWRDFTNQCKITIPKNIYYTDQSGRKVSLGNTSTNLGGFSDTPPAFLRGDEVTLISGYRYNVNGQEYTDTAIIFEGFITKISSKKPFTLECEDNMYLLKQIPAPNKVFKESEYTLESMFAEMLSNQILSPQISRLKSLTVNKKASTKMGDQRVGNETVMDVLARFRKDYHCEAYFRGNELFVGFLVVYQDLGNTYKFIFQENIIEDELEYKRKDDIVLSAIGQSIYKVTNNILTKDGHKKSKTQQLKCLVTYQNGNFTVQKVPFGKTPDFPPNYTGERRDIFYPQRTNDIDKIVEYTKAELIKYYYSGFHGKFTTFGAPFVRQGDNVDISDKILPERDGVYKVKSVEYSLTVDGGLRQVIELDYRIK